MSSYFDTVGYKNRVGMDKLAMPNPLPGFSREGLKDKERPGSYQLRI
jgi:hypothetical protein